jgi:hypothetical protein
MNIAVTQKLLLSCLAVGFLFSGNAEAQIPSDSTMISLTNEFNRSTPLRYDAGTLIDSLGWTAPTKTLTYTYTLLTARESWTKVDEAEQYKKVVNRNCTHLGFLNMINHGMRITHAYYDVRGKAMFTVSVDRQVCTTLVGKQS